MKAAISSARPQLSVSGNDEWFTSGGRNAVAAATPAATSSRKRSSSSQKVASSGGHEPGERDVEQGAAAREGIQRRAYQRDCDASVVEGLVVSHPRRISRLLRVSSAELGGQRAAERSSDRLLVTAAPDLEHARLVVEGIGGPSHRLSRSWPDRNAGKHGQNRSHDY